MNVKRGATTIVLLTALLAGCSGLPGGDDEPDGGKGGSAAVAAGKPAVDSDKDAIVKAAFPSGLAPGAKVDIAIMSLKVRGKLATLSVQLTPHVPQGVSQKPSPYELNGNNGLGVSLIDPVNLKRYIVVRDSSGKELQSDDVFTHIATGQPGLLTYTFAAPPENVKALDLHYGSWPTFRNIPVKR
ncbi:hypothetical protein [Spirillospora sp. CA-294931]|uniref:hypothetical protein n=1 Tax=Spirillospora sp. CA-294931 TaxID=3240042 RepID=UPI003D8A36D3